MADDVERKSESRLGLGKERRGGRVQSREEEAEAGSADRREEGGLDEGGQAQVPSENPAVLAQIHVLKAVERSSSELSSFEGRWMKRSCRAPATANQLLLLLLWLPLHPL